MSAALHQLYIYKIYKNNQQIYTVYIYIYVGLLNIEKKSHVCLIKLMLDRQLVPVCIIDKHTLTHTHCYHMLSLGSVRSLIWLHAEEKGSNWVFSKPDVQ